MIRNANGYHLRTGCTDNGRSSSPALAFDSSEIDRWGDRGILALKCAGLATLLGLISVLADLVPGLSGESAAAAAADATAMTAAIKPAD